jgi:Na+/proline symporter
MLPLMQVLGGWTLIAILCASMSTGTGAILATSTVMSHNIWRKVPGRFGSTDENLLRIVRFAAVPMTIIACVVAALAYNPGGLAWKNWQTLASSLGQVVPGTASGQRTRVLGQLWQLRRDWAVTGLQLAVQGYRLTSAA